MPSTHADHTAYGQQLQHATTAGTRIRPIAALPPGAPLGRRRSLKPDENLPPRRAGATNRVARRVTCEDRRPVRPRVTDRCDALLAAVGQQSVPRGVLPALWDLAVDGTPVRAA
ncbi:MAG: hypothetical protein ACP5QO_09525, partial [Clostridia bacterium]